MTKSEIMALISSINQLIKSMDVPDNMLINSPDDKEVKDEFFLICSEFMGAIDYRLIPILIKPHWG